MLQDEQTLRRTVAKNIAAYRKSHKDTQLDLARKLNYSDKSVSKWERGEGLPDVYILAQIAQLYGVTVSNLIGEEEPPKKANPHFHIYVLLLSVALVFVLAAILFTAFTIAAVPFPSWLFFLYAVPVSSIVCIVFTSLWWGILMQTLSITALIWSAGACIYLSIPIPIPNLSLIFVVCAAVQVLITLWELFRFSRTRTWFGAYLHTGLGDFTRKFRSTLKLAGYPLRHLLKQMPPPLTAQSTARGGFSYICKSFTNLQFPPLSSLRRIRTAQQILNAERFCRRY